MGTRIGKGASVFEDEVDTATDDDRDDDVKRAGTVEAEGMDNREKSVENCSSWAATCCKRLAAERGDNEAAEVDVNVVEEVREKDAEFEGGGEAERVEMDRDVREPEDDEGDKGGDREDDRVEKDPDDDEEWISVMKDDDEGGDVEAS